MKSNSRWLVGLFIFGLCLLMEIGFPPRAYAYLDPGSGSYFIQFVVASVLGAAFAFKVYWKKIQAFFVARTLKRQGHDEIDR